MASINPGYMGYAKIGEGIVRFQDANITVRQEINAPEIVMGNYDRVVYTYATAEVGGSISGPVTENFSSDAAGGIWEWATQRDQTCGGLESNSVDLYYFCGNGGKSRSFQNMFVNSLNFSCSAGDIAQFSLDVLGKGPSSDITWGEYGTKQDLVEKLVTWDVVSVGVSLPDFEGDFDQDAFSSFDLTISNNLETVYAIHENADYFPFDIVPGVRSVSGSLSVYNIPEVNGADDYGAFEADQIGTMTFDIGSGTLTAKVQFHRVEPSLSTGPIISTVGFTGVGIQGF